MRTCCQDECVLQTKNAIHFTATMGIAREWLKVRNVPLHMIVSLDFTVTLFMQIIIALANKL